jgi:uncharacterized protein
MNKPMPRTPQHKPAPPTSTPDGARGPDVDPRWLLKMLAVTIGGALFCGYLTLCGLFYQGQWQLVLHPDNATTITPASTNLPFEDVNFDFAETGQPQLHGWWIPATQNARYSTLTVLYLHGGNGSLADTLPRLQELHNLGLNVFAFDYRGFGQSTGPHPNERRMREDAAAAWLYLTQKRKVPATQVVPYGEGVGAALATQLLVDDPQIPAVILDSPIFDLLAQVRQDPRSQLIPVRLFFRERFALTPLDGLKTPKLILLNDGSPRSQSISRFLDEYLHPPAVPQQ